MEDSHENRFRESLAFLCGPIGVQQSGITLLLVPISFLGTP